MHHRIHCTTTLGSTAAVLGRRRGARRLKTGIDIDDIDEFVVDELLEPEI